MDENNNITTDGGSYLNTMKRLQETQSAYENQYSQGLLDIQSMGEMQMMETMQTASKYGVSPANMQAGLMQGQQQQMALQSQISAEYELGMSELNLQRESMEDAKNMQKEYYMDIFRRAANEGTLTEAAVQQVLEDKALAYGDDFLDMDMIKQHFANEFVTDETAELNKLTGMYQQMKDAGEGEGSIEAKELGSKLAAAGDEATARRYGGTVGDQYKSDNPRTTHGGDFSNYNLFGSKRGHKIVL